MIPTARSHFTKEEYTQYYDNLVQITDEKRQKINLDIHSIVSYDRTSIVRQENEHRIAELEEAKNDLLEKINKLKEQLTNPAEDKLSLE